MSMKELHWWGRTTENPPGIGFRIPLPAFRKGRQYIIYKDCFVFGWYRIEIFLYFVKEYGWYCIKIMFRRTPVGKQIEC